MNELIVQVLAGDDTARMYAIGGIGTYAALRNSNEEDYQETERAIAFLQERLSAGGDIETQTYIVAALSAVICEKPERITKELMEAVSATAATQGKCACELRKTAWGLLAYACERRPDLVAHMVRPIPPDNGIGSKIRNSLFGLWLDTNPKRFPILSLVAVQTLWELQGNPQLDKRGVAMTDFVNAVNQKLESARRVHPKLPEKVSAEEAFLALNKGAKRVQWMFNYRTRLETDPPQPKRRINLLKPRTLFTRPPAQKINYLKLRA